MNSVHTNDEKTELVQIPSDVNPSANPLSDDEDLSRKSEDKSLSNFEICEPIPKRKLKLKLARQTERSQSRID